MSKLGALHITNPSSARHTATVILFHGSGGNGDDMKQWVDMMVKNFTFPHIKVLFPTAPLQPYTPSGGLMSNVWFDRENISIDAPEKKDSIYLIKNEVLKLIEIENNAGIPSNRIIAGGFSMGGALSLYTGYLWEKNLAGVFAFSSFLNDNSIVYDKLRLNPGQKIPQLFQLHGDSDDLVPLKWGKSTYNQLTSLGVQGQFHVLDKLGHSINKRGMFLIKEWIEKLLPDMSSIRI